MAVIVVPLDHDERGRSQGKQEDLKFQEPS